MTSPGSSSPCLALSTNHGEPRADGGLAGAGEAVAAEHLAGGRGTVGRRPRGADQDDPARADDGTGASRLLDLRGSARTGRGRPGAAAARGRRTGCAPVCAALAVANWMCAAIEATPTSGRRALTQLMRAARLNGSGSAAAPSATSSQIVGRPAVLIPHANPCRTASGTAGTREHAIGRTAAGCGHPGCRGVARSAALWRGRGHHRAAPAALL